MKISITGGTGFIGSRLALHCAQRDVRVRVLGLVRNERERDSQSELERHGVAVTGGSVTDRDRVTALVGNADTVIHLAAVQHEISVPESHYAAVNIDGTRNVVEACVAAGVRHLIHGSTIGVYEPAQPVSEATPTVPANVYGRTKLQGERIVRKHAARLPSVVLRISETYGGADPRLLKLFRHAKRGWCLLIGSGSNLHQPIHIDDLVAALWQAATGAKSIAEPLVVAGPEALSTRQMIELVAQAVGQPVRIVRAPWAIAAAAAALCEDTLPHVGMQPPLHRRRLDFFRTSFAFAGNRTRDQLDFRPNISFAEGARLTAAWYEKHGWL